MGLKFLVEFEAYTGSFEFKFTVLSESSIEFHQRNSRIMKISKQFENYDAIPIPEFRRTDVAVD